MEGFSWTVSGATILAILGWFGTVALFVYKRGGDERVAAESLKAAHKKLDDIDLAWKVNKTEFDKHLRELEHDRQNWREGIEKELDQRLAGIIGQHNLLRDQLSEVRENIAKNYMTKPEISAIESRVTDGQVRIIDRLEKFEGRLSDMQKSILEAIRKNGS